MRYLAIILIFLGCNECADLGAKTKLELKSITLSWEHDGFCQGFLLYVEGVSLPIKIASDKRSIEVRIPKGKEKCFALTAYGWGEESMPSFICSDWPQEEEDKNERIFDRSSDILRRVLHRIDVEPQRSA